ncbi:MAG: glutathione S-transferase family protein [Roseovarius sp.]
MSQPNPCLTGYSYSVYTRAVHMAFVAKDVAFDVVEADPFDPATRADLPHPFGRVPVLIHGSFQIYETQAILDYVDHTWTTPEPTPEPTRAPKPALTPATAIARARMRQVMGIADAYVYAPLVRQVVSQAVFAPLDGHAPDQAIIAKGMQTAPGTLAALEAIAAEGLVLRGDALSLADCLLWPMLDYFRTVPEGAQALGAFPHLSRWAAALATHPAAQTTAPDLKSITR